MKTSPTVLGNQARICREDPLPQPPYVLLGLAPVHLVPVREAVLWSVHRDGADASAPGVPLMVSNLPFGSGVSACFPPQAHQARVSALSGRDSSPCPAGYAGATGGGASSRSRFPAAFRPPAFASRAFLRPLGS
jgi:hypothetical protein